MSDLVRDTIAALVALQVPLSSVPLAPLGYGIDLLCVSDIDPSANDTTPDSLDSLAQDCFHRVTTTRGAVPDDPNFGIDLRALLSTGVTPSGQLSISTLVHGELTKDDRIADSDCTLTISGTATAPVYSVSIAITPNDSTLTTFVLVVTVTDGAALLAAVLK